MVLLFTQEGCTACAAALPEFERFKARNPMQLALQLDADGPYAAHFFGAKPIKATPLYVLKRGEEGVTHIGTMKAEQLEKWLKAASGALS